MYPIFVVANTHKEAVYFIKNSTNKIIRNISRENIISTPI